MKKTGRKKIRVHPNLEKTVIKCRESLRHQAEKKNKGRETIRRRHQSNLDSLLKKLPISQAPDGDLIAIIDGWHVRFKKQKYIVYLILLRPVNGNRATIMEPIFLQGYEVKSKWEYVFNQLDPSVRKRIKAVVLDGITGVECFAHDYGWIVQRCHFHVIAMLNTLKGQTWKKINNKELREKIYQNCLIILNVEDKKTAKVLAEETKVLLKNPDCPQMLKRRAQGFLRRVEYFRAYRNYPTLRLPTTTNSAECVWQKVTEMVRLTRGFSTPQSFEKWIKIQIRSTKSIQCNPKIFNRVSVS